MPFFLLLLKYKMLAVLTFLMKKKCIKLCVMKTILCFKKQQVGKSKKKMHALESKTQEE